MSVCLYTTLCLSICLFVSPLSVRAFVCILSGYVYDIISVCLSTTMCLSVCLSTTLCLSVYAYSCLSAFLHATLSNYLSDSITLPLSIALSLHLSNYFSGLPWYPFWTGSTPESKSTFKKIPPQRVSNPMSTRPTGTRYSHCGTAVP